MKMLSFIPANDILRRSENLHPFGIFFFPLVSKKHLAHRPDEQNEGREASVVLQPSRAVHSDSVGVVKLITPPSPT